MPKQNKLRVTLIRSLIGRLENHKQCARGLGLRRLHHTVDVVDNAITRGLITKINYLLKVEEV